MGKPQEEGVPGRIPLGDARVVAGEPLGKLNIEYAVRVDEGGFPDLVDSNKQTKPRQSAKAQKIGFP